MQKEKVYGRNTSVQQYLWCVITAADHKKFTKALVTYLEEMRHPPDTEYEIQGFQKGNNAVKRSCGYTWPWNAKQNCEAEVEKQE